MLCYIGIEGLMELLKSIVDSCSALHIEVLISPLSSEILVRKLSLALHDGLDSTLRNMFQIIRDRTITIEINCKVEVAVEAESVARHYINVFKIGRILLSESTHETLISTDEWNRAVVIPSFLPPNRAN